MSATTLLVAGLSFLSLGLQLWKGRTPERIAAIAFLVAMLVTPMVDHFHVGGLRWGVGLLAIGLFVTLSWLSLVANRWWLLAAAGIQLLSIATYLAAMFDPGVQVWASVSFRIVVWVELMLIGLFGVWEAQCAPYARSKTRGARASQS